MRRPVNIRVRSIITGDAGIVEIEEVDDAYGPINRVSGTSKREPLDKPDELVGFSLAYARALRKLANKYEKQAQGIIKTGDHNREHRKAVKQRKDTEGQRKVTSFRQG